MQGFKGLRAGDSPGLSVILSQSPHPAGDTCTCYTHSRMAIRLTRASIRDKHHAPNSAWNAAHAQTKLRCTAPRGQRRWSHREAGEIEAGKGVPAPRDHGRQVGGTMGLRAWRRLGLLCVACALFLNCAWAADTLCGDFTFNSRFLASEIRGAGGTGPHLCCCDHPWSPAGS